MADDEIQFSGDDESRKALIRQEISDSNIQLAPVEEDVDLGRAKKIPLGEIASIGVAFSALPEAFRTVTQTVTMPSDGFLMKAFDAAGHQLHISDLNTFNDGSGSVGSIKGKAFEQAHFVAAGPQSATASTVLPVNPALIAAAIALQQINQKLDNIQSTVDEMYDYMKQHDKAQLQGNLKTLADILNSYSVNYSNSLYVSNTHMKVLDIKQEAVQSMDFYRGRAESKLNDHPPVELRGLMAQRLNDVLDALKDYQLSTYIYSFATFLEPLLSENFNHDKMNDVIWHIEDASNKYREFYSHCYDEVERRVNGTVDAALIGGFSGVTKFIGGAIGSTPVGDLTPIDDAFNAAGDGAGSFNDDENSKMLEKLHQAKSPDVLPFLEKARSIDSLYNEPSQLLTDGENLYLLPEE